jgi:aspartate aminotransferase
MRIASRVRGTSAPPLTRLTERAARLRDAGRELCVLAQAMVDYAPPRAFTRALEEALNAGRRDLHAYAPDPGLPPLREALGRYLTRSFGLDVDPAREILVTPGANHAGFQALSALLEPGDEALLVTPWYFNHEMTVRLLGARVRTVMADAANGFVPSVTQVGAAWTKRTRVLVLINPNNPTGARYPDAWLRALGETLARDERWREVWVLSDQTYQELVFEGGHPLSPAAVAPLRGRVLTVGSFSKSFALAGWRLGFLAGPADFLDEVLKIQDSSVICAPRAAQWGLAAALEAGDETRDYLEEKRALLRRRRDALLTPLLADGRLQVQVPGGACFAFVGLPETRDRVAAGTPVTCDAGAPGASDGERFAWELMERTGIVVVPGIHFGPEWGRFVRISFGTEGETRLEIAAQQLLEFLSNWQRGS